MKRVVITGAAGNMGQKLSSYLKAQGAYDLRLLDVQGGTDIITCDLTRYSEEWASHFENADAVVHLAADRSPTSDWDSIIPLNIDLLINVYEAARRMEAKRIVFASSNWVVGGHRFGTGLVTNETPPRPINPYGAAKLFGERLGKSLSELCGISVINLRIGYVQWTPGNKPGPKMELGAWGQMIWLSDRDYQQVMEKAINVPDIQYATLNAASNVNGGKFDISETRRLLGYEPQDTHTLTLPLHRRFTNRLAWVRDVGTERLKRTLNPDW